MRAKATTNYIDVRADRPNPGYVDDIYLFALDAVTLTCTPASEANSTETTGLRVDGRDSCYQDPLAGVLKAQKGWIRWQLTPRHDAANLAAFWENNHVYMMYVVGDAVNFLYVRGWANRRG